MQRECVIEQRALLTVLLHAAKHPTTAVNGVLLGTVAPAASDGSAAVVTVTTAVPVCHTFITLAPVIETAIAQVPYSNCNRHACLCEPTNARFTLNCTCTAAQVEEHVKEQQGASPGLRMVGYYQCNERFGDSELGGGRRVADRIESACPDSVALVVRHGAGARPCADAVGFRLEPATMGQHCCPAQLQQH